MKKFNFSLQKVLEVKQIEEKQLQKRLREAQEVLSGLKLDRLKYLQKLDEQINKIEEMCKHTINSAEYMLHKNYIEEINHHISDVDIKIIEQEKEIDKRRDILLSKVKEKKSLEKLRESRLDEHKKQYKKEEQEFMDELSIQKARLSLV